MGFRSKPLNKLFSIHGTWLLQRKSSAWQLLPICIFLFCAAFGVWQITGIFQAYLANEAKTTLTRNEFETIDFPAITFCPLSLYKRNEIGIVDWVYAGAYAIVNDNFKNMAESSKLGAQMCADSTGVNGSVELSNTSDAKRVFFDSLKNMVECRFNNKPLDCTKIFLNRNLELGWCFTFNPGLNILAQYKIESDRNSTNSDFDSYGTTVKDRREYTMRSGLKNSLSFLININISQACIPIAQNIPGMAAIVHDPTIEPFLSTKSIVILPPGMVSNVAISFKKIVRNTESMGRCKSYLKLKWYPYMTEYSTSDAYIINCLTTLVTKKCNCLPYFAPRYSSQLENFSSVMCASVREALFEGVCMSETVKQEYLWDRTCYKKVPVPCAETQLTSRSVVKTFPTPNSLLFYKRKLSSAANMDLDEFRKNFLLVNFYLKDRKLIQQIENPAMTWIDLLNKAGGTLGMCLGMSLLSIVELATWLPYFSFKKGEHFYRQLLARQKRENFKYHS